MKRLIVLYLTSLLLLTACHRHHEDVDHRSDTLHRTVLVYVAGDNNLADFVRSDLMQMRIGSKSILATDKLVLFIDKLGENPKLVEVNQGDTVVVKQFSEQMKSSDPEMLRTALEWTIRNYESESYGLVLWGHADGWIIKDATLAGRLRRAYGADISGSSNPTWMEITSMAKVLEALPKLKFIFADCCAFQCVESAYELRNCADYIIASPAEIPGDGAPYQTVVPALFSSDANFYQQVADAYYAQTINGFKEPISVVKTSALETLAQATHTVLASFLPQMVDGGHYPDVKGLIYYYDFTQFDMNDFIMHYASENEYRSWKQAFDQTVIYRTVTTDTWMANHVIRKDSKTFRDFVITEERCGGMGMFIPQDVSLLDQNEYYTVKMLSGFDIAELNTQIQLMQWYKGARLASLGW